MLEAKHDGPWTRFQYDLFCSWHRGTYEDPSVDSSTPVIPDGRLKSQVTDRGLRVRDAEVL